MADPGDRQVGHGPNYLDLVLDRIRLAASDERRWLTIAYIFSPGHISMSYDHRRAPDRDAYRAQFSHNQQTTAAEIDAVMGTIRAVDPGSIVLVFGDHGPFVWRLSQREADFAAGPEFYVHTRHAVRMAIWPAATCGRELDAVSREGFITVAQAVRAIVTCMSDGLDPVNKSVTYSLPYGNKDSYGKYLYEERAGAPGASPGPRR